jgi:ABC-type transport system involved in multi-copper enzyme maturation permease subunit
MSWALWRRQVRTLAVQQLRRSIAPRRVAPLAVLAGMTICIALVRAVVYPDAARSQTSATTADFGQLFFFFLLRFVVFFGSADLFVKIFRGEILSRSLHYSLLAPVRREVLVTGKYLGGVLAAGIVLLPTTFVTFLLFYVPHLGRGVLSISGTQIIGQLAQYLLVVSLAIVAYGALFTLVGLTFRNPMVPALVFLGWEVLTPFLPPLLKALTVVHYLASLLPVPPAFGDFALLTRPVPDVLAATALAALAGALVTVSSLRARRLEITYSSD